MIASVLLVGALLAVESLQGLELAAPDVSVRRGFFREPFDVELTSFDSGATVRYTLDGSTPTRRNGHTYEKPIRVEKTTLLRAAAFRLGLAPSPVETHSYLFLEDVIGQPALPVGFPDHWTGSSNPGPVPADYEMDPEIVAPPSPYADRIEAALLSLPTVSIVTDMANLFDPSVGIYANPRQEGAAWERPASVEFFDPNGSAEFQIDCGLRIQGRYGRDPSVSPKHSFRLLFRSKYGPPRLRFPLFGEGAAVAFDSLALRAGTHDSWLIRRVVSRGKRVHYIRDQWTRDAQLAMGQTAVHGRFVHLYLNGAYWGVYNFSEWPNAAYMADYFGGHEDYYDVIKARRAVDGDKRAWDRLWAIAKGDPGDDASYDRVQEYLHLDSFIDYLIVNHYVVNEDWELRNWLVAKAREPGATFRYFVWDADMSFSDVYEDNIDESRRGSRPAQTPTQLLERLRQTGSSG